MKRLSTILFLSTLSLWAGIDDAKYAELRLQGEFSFAEIVKEAESQFGINIRLPQKPDDVARSNYNQIISLSQLVDAIVVQFAQRNIPLEYTYKNQNLLFSRRDQRPKKTTSTQRESKVSTPKYPIPVISQPAPTSNHGYPTMPDWAKKETEPNRSSSRSRTSTPASPAPSSSFSSPPSSRSIGVIPPRSATPTLGQTTRSPRPISPSNPIVHPSNPSSFDVKIPPTQRTRLSAQPDLVDAFEEPISMRTPQTSSVQNPPTPPQSYSQARPEPQPKPRQPIQNNNSFGITPYPTGAVGFINDAPSIVPSVSTENYIEWTTRLQGALKSGNWAVLEKEERELQRRLRWLRKQLP